MSTYISPSSTVSAGSRILPDTLPPGDRGLAKGVPAVFTPSSGHFEVAPPAAPETVVLQGTRDGLNIGAAPASMEYPEKGQSPAHTGDWPNYPNAVKGSNEPAYKAPVATVAPMPTTSQAPVITSAVKASIAPITNAPFVFPQSGKRAGVK